MTTTFYSQREAALSDFQALNLKNKNAIDQAFAVLASVEGSLNTDNWPAGTKACFTDIEFDAKKNPDDPAFQDQYNRFAKLEAERLVWIGRGQVSVAVWNTLSALINGQSDKEQTKASLQSLIDSL